MMTRCAPGRKPVPLIVSVRVLAWWPTLKNATVEMMLNEPLTAEVSDPSVAVRV